MQDQYTGDFGDYIKYALLRRLATNGGLGIAWYKYAEQWPIEYGRTIEYLNHEQDWQYLDHDLFDTLNTVVQSGVRATSQIEASGLFRGARFANEPLPVDVSDLPTRRGWRTEWFERTIAKLSDRQLVYIDPDKGICPNNNFAYGRLASWQHVPLCEIQRLELDGQGNRRPVIVYHTPHRNDDHETQIQHWKNQLNCQYAFYCSSGRIAGQTIGPRIFFVLNTDAPMEEDLRTFANDWNAIGRLV